MGTMPIPISEIVAWLELNRIHDFEERIEYFDYISLLDSQWMKLGDSQKETDTNADSTSSN